MNITGATTIEKLLENEQAFEALLALGFNTSSKEELINLLGKNTMLQTVLKVKNINSDLFLKELEEKINNEMLEEGINNKYYNESETLNFLGNIICPLRIVFEDDLKEKLEAFEKATGKTFNCYIMPKGGDDGRYDNLWKEKDIDKFPDIILSKGFDDFYRKELIDNLVSKGHFKSINNPNIDKKFIEAGCLDEDYTMYGAFLDVLLVDEEKLEGLPIPKTWGDLLSPIYKDKIVTFETPDGISTAIPLYFYKEYGEDSIRSYAFNVKGFHSSAKMARLVGSNNPEAGAIYTMPLMFAMSCVKKGVKLVIPEDGAIVFPFSMLVKKGKEEELRILTDYIFDNYGLNLTKSHALSLSPNIENPFLKDHTIKWLGWEFIRSRDIIELGEYINEEFFKVWNKK